MQKSADRTTPTRTLSSEEREWIRERGRVSRAIEAAQRRSSGRFSRVTKPARSGEPGHAHNSARAGVSRAAPRTGCSLVSLPPGPFLPHELPAIARRTYATGRALLAHGVLPRDRHRILRIADQSGNSAGGEDEDLADHVRSCWLPDMNPTTFRPIASSITITSRVDGA
jgi:hypothetical protein